MIDDRLELCEGAMAVGMQAIMYKGLNQLKKDLERVLSAGADNQPLL
jgi:FMN phosphatase YigB (HAD superfamily)